MLKSQQRKKYFFLSKNSNSNRIKEWKTRKVDNRPKNSKLCSKICLFLPPPPSCHCFGKHFGQQFSNRYRRRRRWRHCHTHWLEIIRDRFQMTDTWHRPPIACVMMTQNDRLSVTRLGDFWQQNFLLSSPKFWRLFKLFFNKLIAWAILRNFWGFFKTGTSVALVQNDDAMWKRTSMLENWKLIEKTLFHICRFKATICFLCQCNRY